jgi:light-regulated signal transduction histidine kinase (bacteriophytochrome)
MLVLAQGKVTDVEQNVAGNMENVDDSTDDLEEFARVASHDLQEPLRMVACYTELLAKRYKGQLDADADDFIDFVLEGTQRMKALIEGLLLYSRAGVAAEPTSGLSSKQALEEALGNLRGAIRASDAVVLYDDLPKVTMDRPRLVQLFQNLVGNAIKYRGGAVPHVRVGAAQSGAEWIFSVQDNGLGIEAQHVKRIFGIFQRLHGPGEFEGTGIGLAICKKIVERQGGRIWLESEPGKGSTFYFTLPQAEAK